ncbi:hypothetical protein DXN05_16560 [Deminuibacter soli]|uniref:Adhesin domain-containing protein n=1 Tax=Deminuibacter soli TaxID=2291815 RepID=A0A3E1NH01_9BACT|nr:hypothetical protein DXN05_16560 [Deminuibacter soli]
MRAKTRVITHSEYNVSGYGNVRDNSDNNDEQGKITYTDKTITREYTVGKSGEVLIENNNRNFEIKTWGENKVKLVASFSLARNADDISEDELLEKIGISVKSYTDGLQIIANNRDNGYLYSYGPKFRVGAYGGSYNKSENTDASAGKEGSTSKTPRKSVYTVYVPADCRLEIDNRDAPVTISGKHAELKLVANRSQVEIEDVDKLLLRTKYGNTAIHSCKDGEIENENGRMTIKNGDKIDIDSKYGTIELGTITSLNIRSNSEDYDIESVGTLTGRKNYGNLRIGTLTKSIDIEGSNADIRIRNTASSVSTVKIDNKYADVRLPVRDLQNYSVEMQGNYNNVYGSFEKVPVADTEDKGDKGEKGDKGDKSDRDKGEKGEKSGMYAASPKPRMTAMSGFQDNDNPRHFTAKVGSGGGPKFMINCVSCTVDFK